jgi:hypothetical protein
MSHATLAKHVRERKEKYPQFYCANPRCLFRTFNARTNMVTPCPKHPVTFFPRKDAFGLIGNTSYFTANCGGMEG